MYSGPVAANAYYNLAIDGKPEVVALLGPNHTGRGSILAIMNEGYWRTPLGNVEIDSEVANQIIHKSCIINIDATSPELEHSIEVQLLFLQYLYGQDFKFVPICFLMQDLGMRREVGRIIADVLLAKNALIIASTDMRHYEPQKKSAKQKDRIALKALLKLYEKELYSAIENHRIFMCGYCPAIALTTVAKKLGVKSTQLLCYKTSRDIIGTFSAVVGYASIVYKIM